MRIEPFGVELWMNEFENDCELNLAETCVDSLTVQELLDLTGTSPTDLVDGLAPLRLSYGAIEGTTRLRAAIAALYQATDPEQILVTHGAIGANHLVHHTLVEPDDRVISVVPNYQQHYSIPESIGAEVVRLPLLPEDGYQIDLDQMLDQLAGLATPGTKLIALSNPNNPTGALLGPDQLARLAEIATGCGAYILCDEVYRGLEREDPGSTPSIADLYELSLIHI